jgi:hypothetical protein
MNLKDKRPHRLVAYTTLASDVISHNASVYGVVTNDTNPFPSVSSVSNGNIMFPMYATFLTHRIYLHAITLILVCSQLIYEEQEGSGFDIRWGHWDLSLT